MTSEHNSPYRFRLIVLSAGLLLVGIIYVLSSYLDINNSLENKACSTEAKICPDGSAVGRQGPECEFSACLAIVDELPPDLAQQIEACLPLSNWQAKETCDRLIALIQNFDDCVEAGFMVEEIYPARCFTPDGRNFVQPIALDPVWLELKQAVLDCQAVSIMQTHSREVSVTLKDGNVIKAIEPEIDDIMSIAQEAREKCWFKPVIATE